MSTEVVFCKDCKHFKQSIWCKSPNNGISPVTGEPERRNVYFNRLDIGDRCGSTGRYFEPKEEQVKVSFLGKVIAWFKGE